MQVWPNQNYNAKMKNHFNAGQNKILVLYLMHYLLQMKT